MTKRVVSIKGKVYHKADVAKGRVYTSSNGEQIEIAYIAPPDRVSIYLRNLLAILKGKHHENSRTNRSRARLGSG